MTPEQFRQIRQELGWTQRATAEALGVTDRCIRRYEAGDRRVSKPVALLFETIADACVRRRDG
jgi:DNA-binding transcriptional regulator YiaG